MKISMGSSSCRTRLAITVASMGRPLVRMPTWMVGDRPESAEVIARGFRQVEHGATPIRVAGGCSQVTRSGGGAIGSPSPQPPLRRSKGLGLFLKSTLGDHENGCHG